MVVEHKVVNLTLQGGGSHGAFTWNVLDRLLDEERLSFEGITASSAGSVNVVVLAHGFASARANGWEPTSITSAKNLPSISKRNIFDPLDAMMRGPFCRTMNARCDALGIDNGLPEAEP